VSIDAAEVAWPLPSSRVKVVAGLPSVVKGAGALSMAVTANGAFERAGANRS
jgi:hypothetical protein